MDSIRQMVDSFCEIKYAGNSITVCAGNIVKIEDDQIFLKNAIRFMQAESFKGVITMLSPTCGFRVYKADIKRITENCVVTLENIQYVVNLDRRYGYRAVVNLPALVTANDNSSNNDHAVIQNISASGIFLGVHRPFQVNDQIKIKFPLDLKHPHICTAGCQIVRSLDNTNYSIYRYGCRFSEMSDDDRRLVISYMNNLRIKQLRRMFD